MSLSNSKTPAIVAERLTKSLGRRRVVDALSIRIDAGHVVGFLGPNGSGKTTTLRMLCGLLVPDAGHGYCLGFDVSRQSSALRPWVGYMPQRFSLYEDLTVLENLRFMRDVHGLRGNAPIDRELERLQLGPFAHQLAGRLSGGWKQKLALASCLLHEPRILLLDEPTAGVDPPTRKDFWDQLHALAHAGVTILVSTHYMDEAERCDGLAYMAYGHLLASGTADDIIAAQRLSTYAIATQLPNRAAALVRQCEAIDIRLRWGRWTHISGQDGIAMAKLAQQLADCAPGAVRKIDTSLEDAFLFLMRDVRAA